MMPALSKNHDLEMDELADDFSPPSPRILDQRATEQMLTFSALLDTLPVDEKLKALWKQIYENAVTDRKNAMMVWADLYMNVHGKPEMHTMHGDHIAKYMERMEKSNAQLLKLAELVQKLKESDDNKVPTGNSLFDEIDKARKSHS